MCDQGPNVGERGEDGTYFHTPPWLELLVAQSCMTLCDPMDCSLLGSSVPRILQARIL